MKIFLYTTIITLFIGCIFNQDHSSKLFEYNIPTNSPLILSTFDISGSPDSCYADTTQEYGFRIKIKDVSHDNIYHCALKVKGHENAIVSLKQENDQSTNFTHKYELENGWYLYEIEFRPKLDESWFKLYSYNRSSTKIFYDSLTITSTPIDSKTAIILDTLKLTIEENDWDKLVELRENALEKGVITRDEKQEFDAIFSADHQYPALVRFKGDWVDHLQGDKWSFRVQLKDQNKYDGMTEFSLQSPERRNFLKEWLVHQVALENGLHTSDYRFVYLYINNEFKGIYNLEEHFTSNMLSFKNEFSTPVIKIDEEANWELNLYRKSVKDFNIHAPFFEASNIVAYNMDEIQTNPDLKSSYEKAFRILNHLKYNSIDPADYQHIDAKKFGLFLAMCDYYGTHHSMIYHNIRFIWNPNSNMLEPVLYDGFHNYFFPYTKYVHGLNQNEKVHNPSRYYIYSMKFLNIPEVKKEYLKSLEKLNTKYHIDSLRVQYTSSIKDLETLLSNEFQFYHHPWKYFHARSGLVMKRLASGQKVPSYFLNDKGMDCNCPIMIKDIGVQYYLKGDSITLVNYNCHPTQVILFSENDSTKLKMEAYNDLKPFENAIHLLNNNYVRMEFFINADSKASAAIKQKHVLSPI